MFTPTKSKSSSDRES